MYGKDKDDTILLEVFRGQGSPPPQENELTIVIAIHYYFTYRRCFEFGYLYIFNRENKLMVGNDIQNRTTQYAIEQILKYIVIIETKLI